MTQTEFFLYITYKNRRVKFQVTDPHTSLTQLVSNLRHAVNQDGRLIFEFPSIDSSGAPLEYFLAKEDTETHEMRILRPRIGNTDQTLGDYGIADGDSLFVVPDPFPG